MGLQRNMPCTIFENTVDEKSHLICAGLSPIQHTSWDPDTMSPDENCIFQKFAIESVHEPYYLVEHQNITHCKIECEADENCYFWNTIGKGPPFSCIKPLS